MKLTTAGESHGRALTAIIEGLPSNLTIEIDEIDYYLALRQSGYGRGARQKIESDRAVILSGVRNKLTLGSPLCLMVENKDYKNWEEYMSPYGADVTARRLTRVRPGHADLTGLFKYDQTDARNILERASARETAVRVAAGTVARMFLSELGVEVAGYVRSVEGISDDKEYSFEEIKAAKSSELFMPDAALCERAKRRIDEIKEAKDTAGGIIELHVKGMKSGFGSCMAYSEKLDAHLAFAVMSVQAIKGVEIGLGFEAARRPGSRVHDEIYYKDGAFFRKTNNAGGIEGGMSNGEEIVLRAAMKPIPTLMRGLDTVDFDTKEACRAATERSDVCSVAACDVILESVVCFALAQKILERLGGDNMREVKERWNRLPQ
ncbi:MAG TPA: chorismate synthase [Candidatus Borkfalkia avistercoris]|uniref:Chorismate synthase n=1 Tax=Candidatus Borkfalkia avistercoris TaxID=2838504 RepID=A0A9D2CZ38_9FIRM|nr:chorismate synthase [Candidatus Borkfalkia avistercoris]